MPGTPSDISAGDVNLDGVDDIAMSIDRDTWVGRSYGGGQFDAFEWVSTPTLVDLTGDGFPDILAVAGDSVMRNDGTGWFGPPEALPGGGEFATADQFSGGYLTSEPADFNGDGLVDFVAGNFDGVDVLLNDGRGQFSPAGGCMSGRSVWNLVVASDRATVFLGEGNGRFVETGDYAGLQPATSIATGDVDADGHLDLAMAGRNIVTIWQGDGTGAFADPSSYSPTNGITHDVHLALLDGDDRLDLSIVDGFALGTMLQIGAPQISPEIDVKPDSHTNSINVFSRGVIPVAILGSGTFEVADIDVTTLAFGPTLAPIAHRNGHPQDVNNDGFMDLLLHFRTQDTGLACGDELATLTGQTLDGQTFEGTDSIQTVGCRGTGWPSIRARVTDLLDTSSREAPVRIERK